MHAYANFRMKMVIGWRAFWGLKGGQLVYSFIVDNTKYMGNNNGGHGWCCNWSAMQWVDNLGTMDY
jgi:hypothetical protein